MASIKIQGEKALTPRQQRRRQAILTATEKMIIEHGYEGMSVRAIAELADVTEATIYNIYGTKAGLVATLFQNRTRSSFDQALAARKQPSLAFLQALVQEIAQTSLEIPGMAREGIKVLLTQSDAVTEQLFIEHVGSAIQVLKDDGVLGAQTPVIALVRNFSFGMLSGLVLWSSNLLTDDELNYFLELKLYETLLGYVTQAHGEKFRRRAKNAAKHLDTKSKSSAQLKPKINKQTR